MVISTPVIGTYFAFRFYTFFNRLGQALPRSIFDLIQAYSSRTFAFIFYSNNNQGFAFSPSAAFSRMSASYIDFINLNGTYQTVTSWSNHSNPQFVQHCPYGFVSLNSENSLKSQSTNTVLLANQLPDSLKPYLQRYSTILKNSSCCKRNTTITVATAILSYARTPIFPMATKGTCKSIWPTYLIKIFPTCFFGCETLLKFKQRLWVIFHYPNILYIVATAVKRITKKSYIHTCLLFRGRPMSIVRHFLTKGYPMCQTSCFLTGPDG